MAKAIISVKLHEKSWYKVTGPVVATNLTVVFFFFFFFFPFHNSKLKFKQLNGPANRSTTILTKQYLHSMCMRTMYKCLNVCCTSCHLTFTIYDIVTVVSQFLDFNVPSTVVGSPHPRKDHQFRILLHQFKTQVTKSQVKNLQDGSMVQNSSTPVQDTSHQITSKKLDDNFGLKTATSRHHQVHHQSALAQNLHRERILKRK